MMCLLILISYKHILNLRNAMCLFVVMFLHGSAYYHQKLWTSLSQVMLFLYSWNKSMTYFFNRNWRPIRIAHSILDKIRLLMIEIRSLYDIFEIPYFSKFIIFCTILKWIKILNELSFICHIYQQLFWLPEGV